MKEKLPALLASREGLGVACGVFNVLDAKDRKVALKTLPVGEMAVNKIAHLYLVHVANTLDDTQLTKKKLLHECLKQVDELITDKFYQTVLISALLPMPTEQKDQKFKNTVVTKEDLASFSVLGQWNTSKKDSATRASELFKIAQKPLEMFFEEKLATYLTDIREQPVLRSLLQAIAYCKSTIHPSIIYLFFLDGVAKESDLIDEMMR
jgi:hypothetical protein